MQLSGFKLNFEQLYEEARHDRVEERFEEELDSFAQLLRDHYEFKLFLEDPRIAADYKKKELKKICPDDITPNFIYTISMLIDHGREEQVGELSKNFTRLLARDKGILFGRVASVFPLPAALKKKLDKLFSGWSGGRIKLRYDIDENLLGGLRIKFMDGKVWDVSLKYKLESLREAIVQ